MQVAAFVVSMWKVFEDFVTTAIAEVLASRPGRTVPQHECYLDRPLPNRASVVKMAVDLVHLDPRERPQIIFDAKYKYADASGRYPNADHYQMLGYCTALRVDRAWLIYAQGSGQPVERHVINSDVVIAEYPLDLRAAPKDLLAQIELLALRAWASRAQMRASAVG